MRPGSKRRCASTWNRSVALSVTDRKNCAAPCPTGTVVCHESGVREGVEPPLHRPEAPAFMEEGRVAEDVVDVLDGWIGHGMPLVIGVGTADPDEAKAFVTGCHREICVLAAVSAVAGVKSADHRPVLGGDRERERPEERDLVVDDEIPGRGIRTSRVWIRGAVEVVEILIAGQVGHRSTEEHSLRAFRGERSTVRVDEFSARHAVDVEEYEEFGPSVDGFPRPQVAGRSKFETVCTAMDVDHSGRRTSADELLNFGIVHGDDDVVAGQYGAGVEAVELSV